MEPFTETGPLNEAVNSMLYALNDDSSKNLCGILYRLIEWTAWASEVAHRKGKHRKADAFHQVAKKTEEAWSIVANNPELFKLFEGQKTV